MRERALFLTSTVGRAHLSASRAVAEALGDRWQRDELDYLAFMPAWERRAWLALYHGLLNYAPGVWRAWRALTDRPGEPRALRERVSDAGARGLVDAMRAVPPRIVVSTVSGAASLAGAARSRAGLPFVNALVVTHFRAHRHWARRDADVVFVATDHAKADLVRHGMDAHRIEVVGTPVRDGIRPLAGDARGRVRARLGIGGGPMVVVSSGGTGVYRAHDALMDELAGLARPIEVVSVRGEPRGIETRGRARVHHLGFRADFPEILAASDACIGKLGSLTAAEACAAGVPIVVWDPIPGPEEANAAHLVEAGAALWPRTRAELRRDVALALDDGARMSAAGLAWHRPGAAARIAARLEAVA